MSSIKAPRDAASGLPTGKRMAAAVTSPRDPASGLPTGKRMHKPYTVTADVKPGTTDGFEYGGIKGSVAKKP